MDSRKMVDDRSAAIHCARCAAVVIPASRVNAYTMRGITDAIHAHTCLPPMQAKRDFEDEIR